MKNLSNNSPLMYAVGTGTAMGVALNNNAVGIGIGAAIFVMMKLLKK